MCDKLRTIVIGLGHQSLDDHIPAILGSNRFELTGVCDINTDLAEEISSKYDVDRIDNLNEYLDINHLSVDVALVAVPHNKYLEIICILSSFKINIIKEKPFATSYNEALEISRCVMLSEISISMTLQRRYNPIFTTFAQLIKRVGDIYSIEARYVMNIDRLDDGWRASQLASGGGALADLGYHYIDLLVWYFGLPENITCKLSSGNRKGQFYDVEDTAFLQLLYIVDGKEVLCNLIVSRVYPSKEEGMTVFGSDGYVKVERGSVCRVYDNGMKEERLERVGAWPSALVDQLDSCAEDILSTQNKGLIDIDYIRHVAFLEAAYESARIGCSVNPNKTFNKIVDQLEMKNV